MSGGIHKETIPMAAIGGRTFACSAAVLLASMAFFGTETRSRADPTIEELDVPVNVLMINVDSLNDYISPLRGYPGIKTPNLKRLAAMGVNFRNAMVNAPVCSPSRAAAMTGRSAENTGIYGNSMSWKDGVGQGNFRSLVGRLKHSGWHIAGGGKLFHGWDQGIIRKDWSEPYYLPEDFLKSAHDTGFSRSEWAIAHGVKKCLCDFGPGDEGARLDEEVTDWAVQKIEDGFFDQSHRFLSVGLYRPHNPFVVEQRYFDKYPTAPAPPGFLPGASVYSENAPDLDDVPKRGKKIGKSGDGYKLDEFDEHEDYIRGFLASTSFTDANIGRILDAYDAADLSSSTMIVLWSDHGLHLGEKTKFRKSTLWDRSLRVPFMMAGPGIKTSKVRKPVSLLDLYPTVLGMLGQHIPWFLDGFDLSDTLRNSTGVPRRGAVSVSISDSTSEDPKFYSTVRTARYRLIRYGKDSQMELYDYNVDPYEWNNIIDTADPALISFLKGMLPTEFEPPQFGDKPLVGQRWID
jgi:arylsulfatase A-like enzyme